MTSDAADGVRFDGAAREGGRVSLLFVCLGNICRSPTAEGVMRALVHKAGLQERIELDSAGTGGWHVGESPDARATEAAGRRGIVLEGAARKVRPRDFEEFDLILAMDANNLRDLLRMAPDDQAREKVRLLREWGRAGSQSDSDLDVPDPYYGGPGGFDHVLDLVQAACTALLEQLREGDPERAGAAPVRAERGLATGRPPPHESRALPPQARMSLPRGATNARRVGGGDINEAWRVTLADGREAFVKTRSDAGAEEYADRGSGPAMAGRARGAAHAAGAGGRGRTTSCSSGCSRTA